MALNCSELYQVSPRGAYIPLMLPNCGYGRRACAKVEVTGKPGYGESKPRATTAGFVMVSAQQRHIRRIVDIQPVCGQNLRRERIVNGEAIGRPEGATISDIRSLDHQIAKHFALHVRHSIAIGAAGVRRSDRPATARHRSGPG